MANITLKRFTPDDWQDLRDIRLEALAKHPSYFQPSRDETKFTEADWKERIENKNAAMFGLYAVGMFIGLSGVIREKNQASSPRAHLVSAYIREEYRKRGYSRLFYEARIAWAKSQGDIQTVVVEHREDNVPSRRAHQRYGFKPAGSYEESWPDGTTGICLTFELGI